MTVLTFLKNEIIDSIVQNNNIKYIGKKIAKSTSPLENHIGIVNTVANSDI